MNSLCEQLGIEFPIFAFTHCRDVAAAVSRAGGLGVLGIAGLTPDELEVELMWLDEAVGGASYGVDVLIPASLADLAADPSRAPSFPDEHRRFVDELLERHGVPPLIDEARELVPSATGFHATSLIDRALGHPVRLVASALGTPPPHLIEAAHNRDVMVAALVGTAHQAERQRDAGVDVIVAQGTEAGGHTGQISTMVLVPEVVDAVGPLPVLAAGGIARGRQMAAALALGAQGVWTGSVWLTTLEAETHPVVKQKFLEATSSDTVRSRCTTGKPARQLKSAWTAAWDDPTTPDPLQMPLQWALIHEAQERIQRSAATRPGAGELITYFVGQVVGSLNEVKSARQVVLDMVEEYIEVAEDMARSLGS
jgi:NAD(P)H-dependent flavin oxidoreductase YrpB (nitropropane dioxygenase family)